MWSPNTSSQTLSFLSKSFPLFLHWTLFCLSLPGRSLKGRVETLGRISVQRGPKRIRSRRWLLSVLLWKKTCFFWLFPVQSFSVRGSSGDRVSVLLGHTSPVVGTSITCLSSDSSRDTYNPSLRVLDGAREGTVGPGVPTRETGGREWLP